MEIHFIILLFAAAGPLLCFLFLHCVLVLNSVRYMAVAPSMSWRNQHYIRALPDLLKVLYDTGFPSPWPERPTAYAAIVFRRRLQHALECKIENPSELISRHLGLWAFIELHREEIQSEIRETQIAKASQLLTYLRDSNRRQKVIAFLNERIQDRLRAQRLPPPPALTADTVHWTCRLRALDVLFTEHGYHVDDQFSELLRLRNLDNESILDAEDSIKRTG